MEYKTVFVKALRKDESQNLQTVLDAWSKNGYSLHSITPSIIDGMTVGYILIFERQQNN